MSSPDVHAVVKELAVLEGARVDKVFQFEDEVRIRLYSRLTGQAELVVVPGRSIHLSVTRRSAPIQATSLAMQLRKHLSGQVIKEVRQYGFDRIVEVDLGERVLLLELFSKGNLALLGPEGRIIGLLSRQRWRDRDVLHGRSYEYPPSISGNPYDLDEEGFVQLLTASERDLVRALAVEVGLGGRYAEEVCLRASVEKDAPTTEEVARKVFPFLTSFLEAIEGELSPNTPAGGRPAPIELRIDGETERETFDTFNQALDDHYTEHAGGRAEAAAEDKRQSKVRSLEETLAKQERLLEGFKASSVEDRKRGDLIFANLQLVENILANLLAARRRLGWNEIKERLEEGSKAGLPEAKAVVEIQEDEGRIVLKLEDAS